MIKWRNKIEIKKYFTEDESDQSVLNVLNKLIPQLMHVLKSERRLLDKNIYHGIFKENLEYAADELESVIQEFIWIKENIEQNKDSNQYGYQNWAHAFNESLDSLYDLGDVYLNPHGNEKFLWVG